MKDGITRLSAERIGAEMTKFIVAPRACEIAGVMHKAGILVASEGLNPAARGARVAVSNGKRHLVDGPFAESKELVGGFYIIDVKSLEEAIEWALRAPCGMGSDDVLEIRQLTGAEDLPPEILELINVAAPNWSRSVWQAKG